LDELRFANALAAGAVKQDGIAVGFPDRSQLYAAGTVEAKKDAARLSAANQDSLRNLKGIDLEFILLANGGVDICSKVCQVVNLERLSRHWQRKLLRWMRAGGKKLPVGKDRQSG
jgi:hypothetical protein